MTPDNKKKDNEVVVDMQKSKCDCNQQPVKKKKKKNRCHSCRKNVGLLGLKCKCGLLFCTTHVHPESHMCTFDHKSCARENLTKNLTKISANKIEVI